MNTKVDVILRKLREDDFRSGFDVVASDPVTGVLGQTIFNSTTNKIKMYRNGIWEELHILLPIGNNYLITEGSDFINTETNDRLILE